MTTVPRTAATQASTYRQTEQPLRGNQREPDWQHPPAAIAALQSSKQAASMPTMGSQAADYRTIDVSTSRPVRSLGNLQGVDWQRGKLFQENAQ